MSYTLTHVVDGDLLKVDLSGPLESNDVPAIIGGVWQCAQTPGVRLVLIDIRRLQGRFSLSQTFFNIRSYPTGATGLKSAVIELPEHMENAKFHDTAASNMGFKIRHFSDEAEALAWLRG